MNRAFIAASDTTCDPAALTELFPVTFAKLLVVAGMLGLVAQADAGEFFVSSTGGYRYPPPVPPVCAAPLYLHARPRYVPPPRYDSPDPRARRSVRSPARLGVDPKGRRGGFGGAARHRLRPPEPTPAMAPPAEPPNGDVLDQIAGNPHGITRGEVEAALLDWCASHGEAPLCVKLRVPYACPGESLPSGSTRGWEPVRR